LSTSLCMDSAQGGQGVCGRVMVLRWVSDVRMLDALESRTHCCWMLHNCWFDCSMQCTMRACLSLLFTGLLLNHLKMVLFKGLPEFWVWVVESIFGLEWYKVHVERCPHPSVPMEPTNPPIPTGTCTHIHGCGFEWVWVRVNLKVPEGYPCGSSMPSVFGRMRISLCTRTDFFLQSDRWKVQITCPSSLHGFSDDRQKMPGLT